MVLFVTNLFVIDWFLVYWTTLLQLHELYSFERKKYYELWILRDVEGSRRNIIWDTIPPLAWRNWVKPQNNQNIWNSNPGPSEYEIRILTATPRRSNFSGFCKLYFPPNFPPKFVCSGGPALTFSDLSYSALNILPASLVPQRVSEKFLYIYICH
jgi:hypothetical protein